MKRGLKQEILKYLNQYSDFVTSDQIAVTLDVSKITVVRHITEINSNSEEPMILSERGRGYKLNSQVYLKHSLNLDDTGSDERCNEIIKELLLAAPKRLRTMEVYEKFFVSEAVIAKDKLLISQKLEKWRLSFIRSSRHLAIVGTEKDIRTAIMDIVLNIHQMTDINALEEYCKGINNSNDFRFTIQQIEYASTALGNSILYPYNISLFAHIYVLLERIRTYRHVTLHEETPVLLKEEKLFSPEIYSVCKQIIENIGSYIGITPDESEIVYLFEYLSSARISKHSKVESEESLSRQVAIGYIDKVSKILKKFFSIKLESELESHIHYMVQRLLNQVYLPNALLNDIQIEYSEIYEAVCAASTEISNEFSIPEISEDESGFICLYFAKYLELERKQLNAYIVCTTGIGTSELIAVKIRQSFPMLNIVRVTSNMTISKIVDLTDAKVDLLITTVPIPQRLNIPVVLVSSILTNRDIDSIYKVMEEIANEK